MRSGRWISRIGTLIAAAMIAACTSDADPPEPTTGDWHGAIQVPGDPLEIGVTFTGDGKATIDIPVQGLEDVELRDVRTDRAAVEFTIPDIPGDPTFRGRFESERITGDFTQAGQSFALTLERGAVTPPPRPQEPVAPYPYRSEEITFPSGDLTVAGTLTLPQGAGPFPAVLLITGSGAHNRDEEMMGHRPFLVLADALTRAGYAVLRTDDRGIGGTGGALETATYPDLAGDVNAGVRYLRARPDIDPARVGLLGHSEGGYLAPLAATAPDSGVAFAILMAGPAVSGGDVLIEQTGLLARAGGASEAEIADQVAVNTELVALVRAGDLEGGRALLKRANAALPEGQRTADADIDAMLSPYFAALIGYDPAPALSALRIPVLAFFGDKDLQVPPAQSEPVARALLSGSPDATVHTFPGLNHLMQPAGSGHLSEYTAIETTVDPAVLTYVTEWLTRRFPPV